MRRDRLRRLLPQDATLDGGNASRDDSDVIVESLPRSVLGGRYELVRLIGAGAMGKVYEAVDPQLERRVAIKRLNVAGTQLQDAGMRFKREAQFTARLRHPGILAVHDFTTDTDGVPTMVMELLDGDNLANQIRRRGQFSNGETRLIALQVASALAAAHSQGIVHRDLKPSNIFLARERDEVRVKVLDFGVSKLVHSEDNFASTATGAVIGSPRYMSPEQVQGRRDVDTRSDIFSLGAILYELLAAEVPFSSTSLPGLALQIVQEPHIPLSTRRRDVAPALEKVIDRCLAKLPDDRYASTEELVEELASLQKDPKVPAMPLRIVAPIPEAPAEEAVAGTGSAWQTHSGEITRLGNASTPKGFFQIDQFSESIFFQNATDRHRRIEETLKFYRQQLDREYTRLDAQAIQTHRLWLACVLLGFGVLIGGVLAMLAGLTKEGALTTASSVMLYFVQRTFQQREDHYREKADQKQDHLRYGEQWLLAIQTIDAVSDPKERNQRAQKLADALVKKLGANKVAATAKG
jgi:serine/threonine protein kinase